MIEKGVKGGVWHAMHRYVAANNKYRKNYHEDNESSYIMY